MEAISWRRADITSEELERAIEMCADTVAEAVSAKVMPSYHRDLTKIIRLEPANEAMEHQLFRAFGDDFGGDYREGVARFFSQVAFRLMVKGSALHRIHWTKIVDYRRKVVLNEEQFNFDFVHPDLVRRTGGGLVIEERVGLNEVREVPLLREGMLDFTLPDSVSFLKLQEAYKDMAYLEVSLIPDEVLRSIGTSKPLNLPMEEHQRARALVLAQSTRHIGWFDSEFLKGESLPFYHWRRRLTFESLVIQVRAKILEVFNLGLLRVGKSFDYYGALKIDSLPTKSAVDQAIQDLESGAKMHSEIFAPFNY